eukprot:CAMPEP_0198254542 /NCGR_PEP_ID=MMETSP1447-20131203/4831_1 /TAXON_ID=420782 /ORGANISM="Chaetoceros dichaeta, Strain CCMP1751" /LENGTH=310 /DNA_ID=CAMNT_0043940633 /DNA_START=587 /DNA_END=1519 /DNA_ORIENTATION=-
MRPPPFEINDSSVLTVPVNDVPKMVESHPGIDFVVAGAGKTGADAILELLRLGIHSSRIIWVIPNDSWYYIREDLFSPESFVPALTRIMNTFLESNSCEETFLKLEGTPNSIITRLDQNILPKVFKGATICRSEISKLRSIDRMIRLGRIVRIENGIMELEKGNICLTNYSCVIDCTANGIQMRKPVPIFCDKKIILQPIQTFQPVYSAALIAYVETHIPNEVTQNNICRVVSYPAGVEDYIKTLYDAHKVLKALKVNCMRFVRKSRLNMASGVPRWRLLWGVFGPSDFLGRFIKFAERVDNGSYDVTVE